MSNKLKTISKDQLESFISEKVSEYIGEECNCEVSNLSVPNIDSEAHIALHDDRDITFDVKLSYEESA
ncbi:hypothetical protein NC796_00520 [Aliifodinibius sp. S!AR15-10]|uniref:hypothetical protein n=1 Tax=Aliifodinibius sp. S!AR15-10 TaxID=2950437 RepID=UPI00285FE88E|nr:hypothetical protein [Aliifodinibius sp. S!AR15-10]MDR8389597.1 hypothetical protein [Aliifodinibius sp. S!AR15-10]